MLWFAAALSLQRKVESCDEHDEWQEAGDRELQALDVEGADRQSREAALHSGLHRGNLYPLRRA